VPRALVLVMPGVLRVCGFRMAARWRIARIGRRPCPPRWQITQRTLVGRQVPRRERRPAHGGVRHKANTDHAMDTQS